MEWRKEDFTVLLDGGSLYVTFEGTKITKCDIEQVRELFCRHEEADTRMLFHAKHAADEGFTSIVIVTPDTDVAPICMSFSCQLNATLYLKIGRSSKVKIISINNMKEKLELRLSGNINRSIDELCDALVGLHAFAGCDSVSAFAGKGKSRSIKLSYHLKNTSTSSKVLARNIL